jgi:hypothetical protein
MIGLHTFIYLAQGVPTPSRFFEILGRLPSICGLHLETFPSAFAPDLSNLPPLESLGLAIDYLPTPAPAAFVKKEGKRAAQRVFTSWTASIAPLLVKSAGSLVHLDLAFNDEFKHVSSSMADLWNEAKKLEPNITFPKLKQMAFWTYRHFWPFGEVLARAPSLESLSCELSQAFTKESLEVELKNLPFSGKLKSLCADVLDLLLGYKLTSSYSRYKVDDAGTCCLDPSKLVSGSPVEECASSFVFLRFQSRY